MRKSVVVLMLLMVLLLLPWNVRAVTLGDDSALGDDSLVITVVPLDSIGNPYLTAPDSFFLFVVGPCGDSVYAAANDAAGLGIDSVVNARLKAYILAKDITTLVPATPRRQGLYEIIFGCKVTSPLYVNYTRDWFILADTATSAHYEQQAELLDSLQNQATIAEICSAVADTLIWNRGLIRYDSAQAILSLSGLWIRSTTTDSSALVLVGNNHGAGLSAIGGGGNSQGIQAVGKGTQNGILAQASGTGHGIRAQGGATSGYGGFFEARNGNYAGLVGWGSGTSAGLLGYGAGTGPGIQGASAGSGMPFYPLSIELDSLRMEINWQDGWASYFHQYANLDTLFVIKLPSDTLAYRVYFHPGGSPGDIPDSTKTYSGGP